MCCSDLRRRRAHARARDSDQQTPRGGEGVACNARLAVILDRLATFLSLQCLDLLPQFVILALDLPDCHSHEVEGHGKETEEGDRPSPRVGAYHSREPETLNDGDRRECCAEAHWQPRNHRTRPRFRNQWTIFQSCHWQVLWRGGPSASPAHQRRRSAPEVRGDSGGPALRLAHPAIFFFPSASSVLNRWILRYGGARRSKRSVGQSPRRWNPVGTVC